MSVPVPGVYSSNQPATDDSEKPNARRTFLNEVETCILQDRNSAYGDPEDNFADIAAFASVRFQGGRSPLFARPMHSSEVADFMMLVKLARRKISPEKLDHLVDLGGYAGCGYACQVKENEEDKRARQTEDQKLQAAALDDLLRVR